jgi:hypothetical protein
MLTIAVGWVEQRETTRCANTRVATTVGLALLTPPYGHGSRIAS